MKREYGIDILKIVAMLMVVMLHIMGRGGVNDACAQDSHSFRYLIEQILYAFCVPAVDCFVLATGYIMSRRVFKYSRILKLWGEVVFYSFCMAVVATAFCPWVKVSLRDWICVFFPVATNSYWFVTMYVALFFTMPFLNHLLDTLPKRDLKIMIVSGFVLFSLYPALAGADLFKLHSGYSYLWFVYLYLVAGYIADYNNVIAMKRNILMIAAVALPIFSLVLQVANSQFIKMFGMPLGAWGYYSSPEVFVQSVVMLLLFSRISVSAAYLQRVVCFIAPGVFSVYLLHDNDIFKRIVCWEGRFATLANLIVPGMIVGIFGCAIAIFISCLVIDWCRRMACAVIAYRFERRTN